MTPSQLEAEVKRVAELDAKRTPGDWIGYQTPENKWVVRSTYVKDGLRHRAWPAYCDCGAQPNEDNSNFIAHTPQMAKLISYLYEENKRLREALSAIASGMIEPEDCRIFADKALAIIGGHE